MANVLISVYGEDFQAFKQRELVFLKNYDEQLASMEERNLVSMQPWISYLLTASKSKTNMERVSSVQEITGKEVYEYVLRCLEVLYEYIDALEPELFNVLEDTIQWMDVAKGGTKRQRELWMEYGYPLDIHNLGSACIYECEVANANSLTTLLINTHGAIGQYLRGEVAFEENITLYQYMKYHNLQPNAFKRLLYILNKAIIKGVSSELWTSVEGEVSNCIERIILGDFNKDGNAGFYRESDEMRFRKFKKSNPTKLGSKELAILKDIFYLKDGKVRELWYAESALNEFSDEDVFTLFQLINQNMSESCKYLILKPLADLLYYDFEPPMAEATGFLLH